MSNEADKSPKGLDVYANQVEINFGIYDFALTFRLLQPGKDTASDSVATVRMSPGHAKSLALLLTSTIKGYEEIVGSEIFLPEELIKDLSTRYDRISDDLETGHSETSEVEQ